MVGHEEIGPPHRRIHRNPPARFGRQGRSLARGLDGPAIPLDVLSRWTIRSRKPERPEIHYCATCGEIASYGFGAPDGGPVQPPEAWYCGQHGHEGERRWAARWAPDTGIRTARLG